MPSRWMDVSFYDYGHTIRNLWPSNYPPISGNVAVVIFDDRLHVIFGTVPHLDLLRVVKIPSRVADRGGCKFNFDGRVLSLHGQSTALGPLISGTEEAVSDCWQKLIVKLQYELDAAAD